MHCGPLANVGFFSVEVSHFFIGGCVFEVLRIHFLHGLSFTMWDVTLTTLMCLAYMFTRVSASVGYVITEVTDFNLL